MVLTGWHHDMAQRSILNCAMKWCNMHYETPFYDVALHPVKVKTISWYNVAFFYCEEPTQYTKQFLQQNVEHNIKLDRMWNL